ARIGRADDRDDAAVCHGLQWHPYLSMSFLAAAVSASCLLEAVASTAPTLCTLTRTVKRAAWSGPERSITSYSGGLRWFPAAHSCSALLGCLLRPAPPCIASAHSAKTTSRVG